jgi:hypothetical protein
MAEPDNLILVHLRDLRADIQGVRQDIQTLREEMDRRFEAVDERLDAMHANGMNALKRVIGIRSIFERTMASVDIDLSGLKRRLDEDVADLERRVEQLEAPRT